MRSLPVTVHISMAFFKSRVRGMSFASHAKDMRVRAVYTCVWYDDKSVGQVRASLLKHGSHHAEHLACRALVLHFLDPNSYPTAQKGLGPKPQTPALWQAAGPGRFMVCRRRQRLGERLLGCDQSVPFSRGFNRGYIGIMDKKMETTIVY